MIVYWLHFFADATHPSSVMGVLNKSPSQSVTVAQRTRRALGNEQSRSSIPGSVGYISYPMFIEPMITRVPSGFSGYIWLDKKNCVIRKIIMKWKWYTYDKLKWCFRRWWFSYFISHPHQQLRMQPTQSGALSDPHTARSTRSFCCRGFKLDSEHRGFDTLRYQVTSC